MSTPRILFVDDEHHVLEALRRVLRHKRREWDVSFACGVDEAVALCREEPFDTVVTDVNMPRKSGFDLLRFLRADDEHSDVPVVVLTGNDQRETKRKAMELGATDLLNKPIDAEELEARLGSVLRMKSYQDEIKAYSTRLEEKVRERTAQLEFAQAELIWRLGKAGEFRDSETGYHVVRVGFYAREIADALGMDEDFKRRVFLTAPLHDIGKIGIPDSILLKPDKLTAEEWVVMRDHTRIGARILREDVVTEEHHRALGFLAGHRDALRHNPFTDMAAEIAEHHHERWDGRGYPANLAGERIPLAARITTVADVFDALCSKRPYKEPVEENEVIAMIRRGSGGQFDPAVVDAFERSLTAVRDVRHRFAEDDDVHNDVRASVEELRRAS